MDTQIEENEVAEAEDNSSIIDQLTTTKARLESTIASRKADLALAVEMSPLTPYLNQARTKEVNVTDSEFTKRYGNSFSAELDYHASKVSNDLGNINELVPIQADQESKKNFIYNKVTSLIQESPSLKSSSKSISFFKEALKIWNDDSSLEAHTETYEADLATFNPLYSIISENKGKLTEAQTERLHEWCIDQSKLEPQGIQKWSKPRLNTKGNLIRKYLPETKLALLRAEANVIRDLLDSIHRRDKENLRSILIVGAKLDDIKENKKELFGNDSKAYGRFLKVNCDFKSEFQANKYIRAYNYFDTLKPKLKNEEFVGIELINKLSEPYFQKDSDTEAVRNYITRKLNSALNAFNNSDKSKAEKVSAEGAELIKSKFSSTDKVELNKAKQRFIDSALASYTKRRDSIARNEEDLEWSKSTAKKIRAKAFAQIAEENLTSDFFLVKDSELSGEYKSTAFDSDKSYSKGDRVDYNDSKYEAIKSTKGNSPDNKDFWLELVPLSVDDLVWNKLSEVKKAPIDLAKLKSSYDERKEKIDKIQSELDSLKAEYGDLRASRNLISNSLQEDGSVDTKSYLESIKDEEKRNRISHSFEQAKKLI